MLGITRTILYAVETELENKHGKTVWEVEVRVLTVMLR